MVQVYGIKNCNTVKKALDWLSENNIAFVFHDFKKEPATTEKLLQWQETVAWEKLINKKGTTWKKLTPQQQAAVIDSSSANKVLLENNSMIKRPIIEYNGGILLGFDEESYANNLI